jgi:hypothetical protein
MINMTGSKLSIFSHPGKRCFFTIQMSSVKFKITADTVVCHSSLLYRWLEEETRVIRNYIRDVINDLKKGFFSHSTLDNGRLYLATGIIPISSDFPRGLYLWHRFARVIFIYFCQDLSPLK